MRTPTFATSARHPATGVVVLVAGVATSSWALVHAAESSARAAWEVPHLTAPDGSPVALAAFPPVLASESLRMSIGWTLTVLAWVAACWVATARQARSGRAWLPLGVGATAVAVQCVLAFAPPNGIVAPVGWPGPAQPIDWSVDAWPLTLADPAALSPLVVLLALAGASWWAQRPARRSAGRRRDEAGVGRAAARRALLAVGVPALALWLGAVTVLVATDAYGWGTGRAALLPMAVLEPGGSLLLLVAAGALISGAGRVGALTLVAAQIATTAPIVLMWWGGSSDQLLLACALSAGASACAATWRPVARALAGLAPDATDITAAPSSLAS
ncbi:MAG TPA: hypothetical protein VFW79_13340 [Cellulomonas sp.]|uniref:hypothetical protein n=1 Tax=Cellulomonas sp. TaxID=40001 RepID=UPI002E2F5B40|nr:hypothetical protein [Cellulomonas sp.]HEX5333619.1 hypothetical protein [Cellulomonas sp.]